MKKNILYLRKGTSEEPFLTIGRQGFKAVYFKSNGEISLTPPLFRKFEALGIATDMGQPICKITVLDDAKSLFDDLTFIASLITRNVDKGYLIITVPDNDVEAVKMYLKYSNEICVQDGKDSENYRELTGQGIPIYCGDKQIAELHENESLIPEFKFNNDSYYAYTISISSEEKENIPILHIGNKIGFNSKDMHNIFFKYLTALCDVSQDTEQIVLPSRNVIRTFGKGIGNKQDKTESEILYEEIKENLAELRGYYNIQKNYQDTEFDYIIENHLSDIVQILYKAFYKGISIDMMKSVVRTAKTTFDPWELIGPRLLQAVQHQNLSGIVETSIPNHNNRHQHTNSLS